MQSLKTIIIMPAYNAARTLERTIGDIPFDYVDEIILVDDASGDPTVELARTIGATHPRLSLTPDPKKTLFTIVQLPKNRGYGGNQKECYRLALAHGADIVVMLHPDYQYDPKLVKHFVEFISDGYFDVMLGSRIRSRREALAGGMPAYKYIANRALSLMMNVATGRVLSEWHTGMRAYKREVLESIPFERFSDDFIFDVQALLAIAAAEYSIGDIPVPCRYFEEASSINFKRSLRYGLLTVWETLKFTCARYAQLFRYVRAGLLSVAANIATYALLLYVFHLWYIAAAVIAFLCGAVVSFTLHKYSTFRERSLDAVHRQFALYFCIILTNLVINAGILYLLVEEAGFSKLFGALFSNGVVAIWSFLLYRRFVFRNSPHDGF